MLSKQFRVLLLDELLITHISESITRLKEYQESKTALMRYMVHHRIPDANFGQYTMFWDKLFGWHRSWDKSMGKGA